MNGIPSNLRRASTHASSTTTSSRITPSIRTRRSADSRLVEDVLYDGDEIGPGLSILGQPIHVINARNSHVPTMRVIRKLGTGSYAVVYLAQEVAPYSVSFLDIHEDSPPSTPAPVGRYFAVKCLAKHGRDQEAQLSEATIHQSLPVHDNVVTFWSTLETESYLLLVLEYVPGGDLFYFLEQCRDYDPLDVSSAPPPQVASLDPEHLLSIQRLGLIASMFSQMCEAVAHCHRNGVFHRDIKPENFMVTDSRIFNPNTGKHEGRVSVKLIDFGLATRDIESGDMDCGSAPYMSFGEHVPMRSHIVSLCDQKCSPSLNLECHNSITPTYATAPADVWSLGIVLINILYHANPWLTTAIGQCASFDSFLREPIPFFMNQFPGMTPAVAEFFARSIFCLVEGGLPNPPSVTSSIPTYYANNIGRRITAERFGQWSRDLQLHLGPSARRTPALAFQQNPNPPSAGRPRSPGESSNRFLVPSVSQPGTRTPSPSYCTRPPVPVHVDALTNNGSIAVNDGAVDLNLGSDSDDGGRSRTTSSKRRKRAPRGKAQPGQSPALSTAKSDAALYAASVLAAAPPAHANEQRLLGLVEKSQSVAREASIVNSTRTPASVYTSLAPTSSPAIAVDMTIPQATPSRINTMTTARSTPELRNKKMKWKDIFKRDSGSDQEVPTAADLAAMDKEEGTSLSSPVRMSDSISAIATPAPKPSATAMNVTSLLKGLEPSITTLRDSADDSGSWNTNNRRSSSLSSRGRRKDRRGLDRESQRAVSPGSLMSVSTASTNTSNINSIGRGRSAPSNDRRTRSKSPTQMALAHFNLLNAAPNDDPPPPVPTVPETYRASVPVPVHMQGESHIYTPAGQHSSRRSYAPSITSVSTTTTSSSAFTAFSGKNKWRASNSNASVRSVSTAATSLSSGSSASRGATANGKKPPPLPFNIKRRLALFLYCQVIDTLIPLEMDGIPEILDEPPRYRRFPSDHKKRENRQRAPSAPTSPTPGSSFGLGTILEKPKKSAMKPSRSPVAPLDPSRFNHGPYVEKTDGSDMGRYQPGMMDAVGSFDPNITSFGAARGGAHMGLQINTDAAGAVSGYASGTQTQISAGEGVGGSVAAVSTGTVKPPKTPTKSRLFNWRK